MMILFVFSLSLVPLKTRAVYTEFKEMMQMETELLKQIKRSKKVALVLGGGGARGSYQIGVWKALKELCIEIHLITGTSVGALNGALFLQDEYDLGEQMWRKMETNHVLALSKPIEINSFKSYRRTMRGFVVSALKKRGFNTTPLKELIDTYLADEKRIRKSAIEFGLTLTEYPSMKRVEFFLPSIPFGELSLYLLGSASFYPAMQITKIGEKSYIDGGYYNNLPVEMALEKKPTAVISVDITGPISLKRSRPITDVPIHDLGSKWPLGNLLLFDGNRADINIALGYYETMKHFEFYEGSWYTFEKDSFKKHYEKFYLALAKFLMNKNRRFAAGFLNETEQQQKNLKVLEKYWRGRIGKKELTYAVHELIGKLFQIDPTKVYSFSLFETAILEKYEELVKATTINEVDELFTVDVIYSVEEWIARYLERIPFLSNKKMLLYFLNLIEKNQPIEWHNWKVHYLIKQKPHVFMMAICMDQIKNGNFK